MESQQNNSIEYRETLVKAKRTWDENPSQKIYDQNDIFGKTILSGNINFTILPNEIIGLLGPSGSGKSTLLKSCCGLIKPSHGNSLLNSKSLYQNINDLRNKIGYVPQDDIIHQDLTVEKAVYYSAKLT